MQVRIGIAMAAGLLSFACAKHHDKKADVAKAPDVGGEGHAPKIEPTAASIQTGLVNMQCLACHATESDQNHGVVLNDISTLATTEHGPDGDGDHDGDGDGDDHDHHHHHHNLIVPGCPDKSLVYGEMRDGAMPPAPAAHISADDLAVVGAWITAMVPEASRDCSDHDEPGDSDDGGDDEPGGDGAK